MLLMVLRPTEILERIRGEKYIYTHREAYIIIAKKLIFQDLSTNLVMKIVGRPK